MITRKTIAIIILLISFGFFYWNLQTKPNTSKSQALLSALIGGNDTVDSKLNFKSSSQRPTMPNVDNTNTAISNNLTDLLSHSYLQEILSENENGIIDPTNLGDLNLPVDLNVENDLLAERVQGLFKLQEFKLGDIRISRDTSPQAQVVYIERIDQTLVKNFSGFNKNIITAIDAFMTERDPQYINLLLETIPEYINDLLAISPPENWKEFHLETLNLWQKKLFLYQAVLKLESDPFKTYLTLKEIPSIIQRDTDLQNFAIKEYEVLKN